MPVTAKRPHNLTLCCLILAGSGLLMLTVGCGSNSTSSVTAADPAASPSSTSAAGTSSSGTTASSASREAYVTCLRQHGATVPATAPTSKPASKPTGMPTGKPGSKTNMIPAAARAACASLRPAGQGDGGRTNPQVQAFDACMKAHGEPIPDRRPAPAASPMASPQAAKGAKPTGIARFLHGLNPGNSQVAAAVKACESDLPTSSGL
jgi:hypothetical protein